MRPTAAPAGYSGTPLARKLGVKEGFRVAVLNAPPEYPDLLATLPIGATLATSASAAADLVHLFVTDRASLAKSLTALREQLKADRPVWVSWPKKASGGTTDVTEDTIREVGLPLGYVDIKVCAVSSVWSGLKLVVRKELR